MKFWLLLLITKIVCYLPQTYSSERDFWNTIHEIKADFREAKAIQPLGPCQPCPYLIQLYQTKLVLHITNSNRFKPASCELQLALDQINFLGRNFTATTICPSPIGRVFLNISRNAKNGLEWRYQISIYDSGIDIKKTQTQYTKFNIFICFVFNVLLFVFFPYSKKQIEKFQLQVYGRTSFFSLMMYMQIVMIIVGYELTMFLSYFFYQPTFIEKIYSYSFIGVCFLTTVIHLGYCFAGLQRKINQMIPQSGIFKLAITSVIFVFGIVAYPLIICLFPKTLWFFFLSSLGIWIQFYHSITNKIFPYAKFIVLYYLNILFLGGLATVYPCGNFIELSPMDFLILFLYSAISYVTISFYLQKKIQVEAGMKVAEESNFNQRQLNTLGSSQIRSQQLK